MATTHYIPFFTRSDGRVQRAACGQMVHAVDHTAEPTCAECKRWLEADAAEAAQFETVEDQVEALFGSSADAPPVTLNTFSSVEGYRRPKGAR